MFVLTLPRLRAGSINRQMEAERLTAYMTNSVLQKARVALVKEGHPVFGKLVVTVLLQSNFNRLSSFNNHCKRRTCLVTRLC